MGIFGQWYLLASRQFWQDSVRLSHYFFNETRFELITIWKAHKVRQVRMGDSHRSGNSERWALC